MKVSPEPKVQPRPCPEAARSDRPVVLSIAFPYAPIGSRAVGGAEVICSHLEAAMATLGFRSVVVAHADSTPRGQLYPTPIPPGTVTEATRAEVEAAQQRNIDRALAEHPIALVHMHGLFFHHYRIPAHIPVLVTLHLPPPWYDAAIWDLPPNYHFVCVSETERSACPAHVQDRITVIGNGIPLPDPARLRPLGHYALMLSRICPEKNLHTGLDAARLAGMPAVLAGEVFPYEAHQLYFANEVQPRLTSTGSTHETRSSHAPPQPTARFLGAVCGDEKTRLLTRAACLLLPSLAPETSSLVAMEALAAGVPVIAMAVGAVPEIVEHGRTGFLIEPGPNSTHAMAEAIRSLPTLDRRLCRAVAEQRFALTRMLDGYCQLYRRLALAPPPIPCGLTATSSPQTIPAPTGPPALELLTDTAALTALAPEWTALWQSDPNATPFQHPAWLLPWWRQFGPDGDLCTLTLRDPDTRHLLGLLPLYTYRQPESGNRQLLLIGAATSDYLDGLWNPSADPVRLASTALDYALTDLRCWDIATLTQLRTTSPLARAAQQVAHPLSPSDPCSTIDLAAMLPPKIVSNASRYRRRAEAQGRLQCTLASTPEDALTTFDHLARLHRERWQSRGEPGVLADPRVLAHHREALPQLLQAGLLRLFHLTLDAPTLGVQTLGVLYALADAPHAAGRRLYLYLVGFDPRFADLSPGTLLVHAAWDHASTHGFTSLDLLRGGESYKQLWGAHVEPTWGIHAHRVLPIRNP